MKSATTWKLARKPRRTPDRNCRSMAASLIHSFVGRSPALRECRLFAHPVQKAAADVLVRRARTLNARSGLLSSNAAMMKRAHRSHLKTRQPKSKPQAECGIRRAKSCRDTLTVAMTAGRLPTRRKMSNGKMPVHLGFVPLNDCAPLVMAQELALFEKYGVEVQLSREVGWQRSATRSSTGSWMPPTQSRACIFLRARDWLDSARLPHRPRAEPAWQRDHAR